MKILLLEPYFTDSHRQWAEGYRQWSEHQVSILSMPGRHWKWRMHGAAVWMAEQIRETPAPDLILASEMLDLATFKALLPAEWAAVPTVLYFHENQLSYPWSEQDNDPQSGRDLHYAWIHVTGCLTADEVWFNSAFHRDSFLQELQTYLRALPANAPVTLPEQLTEKSRVMPLGLQPDLFGKDPAPRTDPAVILWNHRWEYDKNPEAFFRALFTLKEEGLVFRLMVLGKSFRESPSIFEEAREQLADRVDQWGYVESRDQYLDLLRRATVLPVTSDHDFFGLSVLEAMACGVFPLLPNRLVYPEHVVGCPECLYQGENVTSALRQFLQTPTLPAQALKTRVEQLSWQQVARKYDDAISRIVLKNHHT